jgi:hypothetical protein
LHLDERRIADHLQHVAIGAHPDLPRSTELPAAILYPSCPLLRA